MKGRSNGDFEIWTIWECCIKNKNIRTRIVTTLSITCVTLKTFCCYLKLQLLGTYENDVSDVIKWDLTADLTLILTLTSLQTTEIGSIFIPCQVWAINMAPNLLQNLLFHHCFPGCRNPTSPGHHVDAQQQAPCYCCTLTPTLTLKLPL